MHEIFKLIQRERAFTSVMKDLKKGRKANMQADNQEDEDEGEYDEEEEKEDNN